MKTLIHVEDSELILLRLAEWVVDIHPDLHILPATALTEADMLVARHAPDFMVLDINLPDGNALNWIPYFKEMAPAMRIAILSNDNDTFTRDKCLELGADWVFDKALELPKLIEVIGTAPQRSPQTIESGLR